MQPRGAQVRLMLLGLACLASGLFFLSLAAAHAQSPAAENFGLTEGQSFGEVGLAQTSDIKGTIARVINIALGFLGIVAVGLFLYAGFLWMTARGNEEQVKRAKDLLRNALIGLAIILTSWGIAAFIISRLSGATGDGGETGPPGGGPGLGGGLPAERFTLQEFQTAHFGRTNRDDVYRCSNIQPRFNQWVDIKSVAAARAGIKATQIEDGVGRTTPSPMTIDVDARGNSLKIERRSGDSPTLRQNWPVQSKIEVEIPKSITNTTNNPIADCTALGCNDRGDRYAWVFTTTDKLDTTKPTLTSAAPRLPGTVAGYPDRNVDRSLTFVVNFSEAIDFFNVVRPDGRLIPENVKVEQIISDKDGRAVATIPTEHFDASLSATGFQFALNRAHQSALNDGPYLEPYTWYRITLKNIMDLCGNQLAGETNWLFQTNGNIPGVAFTYPSDGYQFACPNTETFVQFRTSMYDVKNSSCVVNPALGGLVQSGSGLASRQLRVSDNVPSPGEGAPPVNPNEFCQRYDFAPTSSQLTANTKYAPEVAYRNPANDSQTNKANWSFDVKPPDGCANAPYISSLSPREGPWGRCVTMQGNYFGDPVKRQGADDTYTKVSLDSPRNLLGIGGISDRIRGNWTRAWNDGQGEPFRIKPAQWADTYLTGEVPNLKAIEDKLQGTAPTNLLPPAKDGILDLDVFVARHITLGGKVEKLQSNTVRFSVPLADKPYQGPCLYTLNPTDGQWGSKVSLTGTNFLPSKDAPVGDVIFTNAVKSEAATWDNTLITDATVPVGSMTGEVKVQTKQGLSNGIRFNITAERGGACVPNTPCGANQSCSERGFCQDIPQPTGFIINDAWPRAACSSACKNAEVGWRANLPLVPSSLTPVVYSAPGLRASGSLGVRPCRADDCRELEAGNLTFTTALSEDNKKLILKWPLSANASYRVIVYGGEGGLRSTDPNKSMLANTNYHTNESSDDAYSWYFKVGPNDCAVDRVRLNKTNLDLYEKDSSDLAARAYAKPDQCSPQDGQILNVAPNFNWKACAYPADGNLALACRPDCPAPQAANKAIIALQSETDKSRGANNIVTGVTGGKSGNQALVCAGYSSGAFTAATAVIVRSLCNSDADCVQGGVCPRSICNLDKSSPNFGRCSPIIKTISPADGQSGTWTTLSGCYFGNSRGVVKYNNTPFLEPALCGNTWSDKQIVAETPVLPAGTTGGPGDVTVETTNKMSVTRAKGFDLNDQSHPGLCRLEPNYGAPGSAVRLIGKNFGVKGPDDKVLFAVVPAAIDSRNWSDTNIVVTTPVLSPADSVAVKVIKAGNPSGELSFRVLAGGTITPPGTITPKDIKAIQYYPGKDKAGQAINACPNQVIEVIFDGPVDPSSATDSNFMVRQVLAYNSKADFNKDGKVDLEDFELFKVAMGKQNKGIYDKNYDINGNGKVELNDFFNFADAFATKLYQLLVGTRVLTAMDENRTRLSFIPEEDLFAGGQYQILLKAGDTGLRSDTGGVLVTGGICPAFDASGNCMIDFKAMAAGSPELVGCQAQAVTVEPRDPIYTCAGVDDCTDDFDKSTTGHQRQFRARTIARNSQPIVVRKGYDWESSEISILSFSDEVKYATSSVRTLTVQPKNGSTTISAKPQETTIQGSTEARVFLCKNPWPALLDSGRFTPFIDNGERPTQFNRPLEYATNFSTFYCRDKGKAGPDEDLPEMALKAEIGKDGKDQTNKQHEPVAGLLKEFFFTVPRSGTQTTDAVGIRVLQNPNNYSALDWYRAQGFAGQTQALKVDGYEAVQDGRTVYVGAPNDGDGDVNNEGAALTSQTIYNNIYLISMSDQTQSETQTIFNQLLNNWRFAVNLKQADNRARLQRDTQRLSDLRRLVNLIATKSAPPALESGSYEKNVSVSVWPSWKQAFSIELGSPLPLDPLNKVDDAACAAAGAEPGTCWLPTTKQFKCLPTNSVYRYQWLGAKQYIVQARLEYQGASRSSATQPGWSFSASNTCGNLLYTHSQ